MSNLLHIASILVAILGVAVALGAVHRREEREKRDIDEVAGLDA